MADGGTGLLDRVLHRSAMRRWSRAAKRSGDEEPQVLKRQLGQARLLRSRLEKLIHTAEDRLTTSLNSGDGLELPLNGDWVWRPGIWRGPIFPHGISPVAKKTQLGHRVAVYHDCPIGEISLRQVRNARVEDRAPFGLGLDVFQFEGSFLSLAIDLPQDAILGLAKSHLLGLDARIALEAPLELFGRLNIRHGPNTEQIVREMKLGADEGCDLTVDFDLAYSGLNERQVDAAWIDLIFENPQMNRIMLYDLIATRRLRAAL